MINIFRQLCETTQFFLSILIPESPDDLIAIKHGYWNKLGLKIQDDILGYQSFFNDLR